ncbi:MAG TPA: FprA family A-type flavoprotein [Firmicutes bacterium]|nr:FprA family A-type flavoprotein [Bacillota bacterium]
MHCTRKVTPSITWVGGSDYRLALFENLFPIPRGVAYNSYVIEDEKTALMDTADASITEQFLENVTYALHGRALDYLVVQHMEPDHCANIAQILLRHPNAKIVCNQKTLTLIQQFYDADLQEKVVLVKDGDCLSLGSHELHFAFTPMVHWPEVMVTYESTEKILFSADAFGSFGAINGNLFADELHFDRDWLADARRYYSNIVGKYGPQVQNALKKLGGLDIRIICPLHGPIWREDLGYLLGKYDLWSRYEPEDKAVCIFFASMYGDTENAAQILATKLAEGGVKDIMMYDISRTDVSYLIGEIFRASHIVLAAPTYNNGVYPAMANLLHDMKALNVQNRTIGLMENGSWAPVAGKLIKEELSALKNITLLEPAVTIRSAVKGDTVEQIEKLKDAIIASL